MITWKKLKYKWVGRCGKYYITIRLRKHYRCEGFDEFWQHYTVYIGRGGEWLYGEGLFGTSLRTIRSAKLWAKNKLSDIAAKENQKFLDDYLKYK